MTRRDLIAALLVLVAVVTVGAQSLRDTEPPVVSTRSYVIGSCTLGGADHELDEGYFHCGAVQVFFPADSIGALRLREEVGQRGELVWRRIPR